MKKILLLTALLISSQSFGAGCTDFSGNWKGQCVASNGKTVESSLAMAQTACSTLTLNNHLIPIGSTSVLSSWSGDIYTVATNALWFSPDQKALEFSIFNQSYKNGLLVYQGTVSGYDEVVSGHLITHSKGTFGDITCTYSIVP